MSGSTASLVTDSSAHGGDSSPAIIRLLITYHNFFRERKGLKNNMTPAEAIGIDIMPVPDSDLAPVRDKWATFIQNATIHTAA